MANQYTINDPCKQSVAKLIQEAIPLFNQDSQPIDVAKVVSTISRPPKADMGNLAFPCFQLAKQFKKNPKEWTNQRAALRDKQYFS